MRDSFVSGWGGGQSGPWGREGKKTACRKKRGIRGAPVPAVQLHNHGCLTSSAAVTGPEGGALRLDAILALWVLTGAAGGADDEDGTAFAAARGVGRHHVSLFLAFCFVLGVAVLWGESYEWLLVLSNWFVPCLS